MLRTRVLADVGGVIVCDVRCGYLPGAPSEPAICRSAALVLVRRGCFTRRVNGRAAVLCPSTAYLQRPGQEETFAHPGADGDECTVLGLEDDLCAELFGEPVEAQLELALPAALAVLHRRILVTTDEDARAEIALDLATRAAQLSHHQAAGRRRRGLTPSQRELVIAARESLAADPAQSLTSLAAQLAVSSHHLSRVFSRATGRGIARHRVELRIAAALQHLQGGEDNLARLAADLGFADHAHLTRTLRRHTDATPSELRHQLHPAGTPDETGERLELEANISADAPAYGIRTSVAGIPADRNADLRASFDVDCREQNPGDDPR